MRTSKPQESLVIDKNLWGERGSTSGSLSSYETYALANCATTPFDNRNSFII
ncbi:hypothetical protein MTR_3g031670 [Medicago truncatula]|uniref:Uncharacterized protein n=1 Tax=Medicago truncatula TaxID=3880 RepID=G7J0R1_MEDTR|nr:hypothetical protein MTR_3g031670 [Medicago truncatula]